MRLTVSEARAGLPELLDRVIAGEEVTITRHGQPVAVVVRPDLLRVRRADHAFAAASGVRDLLERGRAAALPAGGLSEARAQELTAEIRDTRDPPGQRDARDPSGQRDARDPSDTRNPRGQRGQRDPS